MTTAESHAADPSLEASHPPNMEPGLQSHRTFPANKQRESVDHLGSADIIRRSDKQRESVHFDHLSSSDIIRRSHILSWSGITQTRGQITDTRNREAEIKQDTGEVIMSHDNTKRHS